MKAAFTKFATLIILFSCKSSDRPEEINYSGYNDQNILLTGYDEKYEWNDSLASVTLKIPDRLDTFYKWHRTSDCLSCGWVQYRFADRKYPQFAEGGFYWTFVPDSTYQLSICHKPVRMTPDSIFLKPLSEKYTNDGFYHGGGLTLNDSAKYILKDFKYINERAFIISAYISPYSYLTRSPALFVVAATNLKDRELFFVAECSAKDTIGFIDNMYKSFLSIRIKENP